MGGGEDGDTDVDVLLAAPDRDTTVLRRPPLRDVELTHDLESRGHGARLRARDGRELAHDPVDPDAHEEPLLLGGEVDVRGAELERLRDGAVDEDDSRAFVLEVEHGRIVARLLRVGDDLLDLDDAVVDALDRELDRIGGRDADTNRDAEREPQVVREHDVGRVGDGDEDGLVLELSHGDRAVPAGKVLGEQQRYLGLDHP